MRAVSLRNMNLNYKHFSDNIVKKIVEVVRVFGYNDDLNRDFYECRTT